MKRIILLLIIGIFSLSGCSEYTIGFEKDELISLSTDKIEMDCKGGETIVEINAIVPLNMRISGANWVHSSVTNGSEGTRKMTIIVDENFTTSARNATIEIWNSECDVSRTISISQEAGLGKGYVETVADINMMMVYVEGGTFQMGATSEQGSSDPDSDEKPVHYVTLDSYYIAETEVAQAQWRAVMGTNPSYFTGDDRPVECVSWNDAQEFCRRLSELTGKTYTLPTEAQWEYAARGGNKSKGYKYSGSNTIGDVAWYESNSSSTTHSVKQKQPNELGLYDMSGNVWEWCSDWYDSYSSFSQTNPTGPSSGSDRVLRGGGWYDVARICRVSNRGSNYPSSRLSCNGFRVVCFP